MERSTSHSPGAPLPVLAPLLHPLSLLALTLLALNDHVFKVAYPGWLTGKLSDFAGLVFFPLVLEFLLRSRRASVLVTALGFLLVKGTAWGCAAWNAAFSGFYQLFHPTHSAVLVQDPTDLVALVALAIPLLLIPERP